MQVELAEFHSQPVGWHCCVFFESRLQAAFWHVLKVEFQKHPSGAQTLFVVSYPQPSGRHLL
jgi:hypothetical protein